jgi:hypothetical protein
MKRTLIAFSLLFSLFGFSQKEGQENAFFTIRGNLGIPRVVGSQMFRTCFAGLYEGNLSLNLRLFNNFFAGAGYQNTQFQNNKFLKFTYFRAEIPYNTRMMSHSGFIKLGYDKFFSDKGYTTFALNTGMMFNNYFNVNEDTSKANKPFVLQEYSAPFVQPEVSVNFIVEKHLAFSIMLSYTTLFTKFDPKAPRFAHFETVSDARNRYYMNWINIGFGFTILLDKKSKE